MRASRRYEVFSLLRTPCGLGGRGSSPLPHPKTLPCSVFFDENPHVEQGAIIARERLGAVSMRIQADPRERGRQRFASPSLTLRQKHRIRAAQQRATASAPPS